MTRSLWRAYLHRFQPHRRRVLSVLALSILQAMLLLPLPIILGTAIDDALPHERLGLLTALAGVMAGLAIVSVGVGILSKSIDLKVTRTLTRDLRVEVLERFFAMPRRKLDQSSISELHDLMINDTGRVDAMGSVLLTRLLPDGVVAVGITIILMVLDWRLALVTLAFAPVLFVFSRLMMRRMRGPADEFHTEMRAMNARTLLVLRSQDLIRLAGSERHEIDQGSAVLDRVHTTGSRFQLLMATHGSVQQAVIAVAGAALLLAGGITVVRTAMTLGELLSFYAAFAMLRGPAGGFARSYGTLIDGQQALVRLSEFLDDPAERDYVGTAEITLDGRLALAGVTFGYDPAHPVVKNFTLDIAPGSVTALLGPNGSGKSSIVNLLLGFYRPQTGTVTADGRSYDELDMIGLRTQLGVVRQEPFLLPGTVRDNVVYGRSLSDEQLQLALELSGADHVIAHLPDGIETRVGDDGALLSGGQRQRIAIARALAGDPRVIILDEPTNHLDEDAIAGLLKELRRLGTDLAVLLISHQRQVTLHADRVVTLTLDD